MQEWTELFCQPVESFASEKEVEGWFVELARRLLNQTRLLVTGRAYRFVELEFYYNGEVHPDTFAHSDPLQRSCGRWYFHRTHGEYRGGSFKGLDMTFGAEDAFGGALIRSIEDDEGHLIDGPSLCVDRLLSTTGHTRIAALDQAIDGRAIWEEGAPLQVMEDPGMERRALWRSGRVGLSLKRGGKSVKRHRFIMSPYRFLSAPRQIRKGKIYLVLALHIEGKSRDEIHALTGSPKKTIERYIADFQEGRGSKEFLDFAGKDLKPKDLAQLYGVWYAAHGQKE